MSQSCRSRAPFVFGLHLVANVGITPFLFINLFIISFETVVLLFNAC